MREDGKPVAVMDYKSFGANLDEDAEGEKMKAIVMRDQAAGMIAWHFCEQKGTGDKWIMETFADDPALWGHTGIVLKTDGEPAVVAVQKTDWRDALPSDHSRRPAGLQSPVRWGG